MYVGMQSNVEAMRNRLDVPMFICPCRWSCSASSPHTVRRTSRSSRPAAKTSRLSGGWPAITASGCCPESLFEKRDVGGGDKARARERDRDRDRDKARDRDRAWLRSAAPRPRFSICTFQGSGRRLVPISVRHSSPARATPATFWPRRHSERRPERAHGRAHVGALSANFSQLSPGCRVRRRVKGQSSRLFPHGAERQDRGP